MADYEAVIEELRAAEERADDLMMQADTDSLTGLLNRRGLERRTRARDWGWFVAVDLNGFKAAQDAHPDKHAFGDLVLQEFTEFVLRHTRQHSERARDVLIARTGGDEFLVWCETRVGALRIRDVIRAWRSQHGEVTAAAGLGKDPAAADAAMYLHKTGGLE